MKQIEQFIGNRVFSTLWGIAGALLGFYWLGIDGWWFIPWIIIWVAIFIELYFFFAVLNMLRDDAEEGVPGGDFFSVWLYMHHALFSFPAVVIADDGEITHKKFWSREAALEWVNEQRHSHDFISSIIFSFEVPDFEEWLDNIINGDDRGWA